MVKLVLPDYFEYFFVREVIVKITAAKNWEYILKKIVTKKWLLLNY